MLVAPIQVRLLRQKAVQIVLTGERIAAPGRAAELRHPVVRWPAVGLGVTPDVPIALGVAARRTAFKEPPVLIRGVIGDEIENDLETARVPLPPQRAKAP